jgi:hypothetical protein
VWDGASSSFSGHFNRAGNAATGRFTFYIPATAQTAACSGRWTFSVHLAPPVPHGLAVAPAAGASLSGYTYHGEPISRTVNSAGDAISGNVPVLTICRDQATHQVAGEPYNGPLSFSATINGDRFSASASGLQVQGTFVTPGLIGGRLRLTYTTQTVSSPPYICDSGCVPFVAAAVFIPASPGAVTLLQGDLRLTLQWTRKLGDWLAGGERAAQQAIQFHSQTEQSILPVWRTRLTHGTRRIWNVPALRRAELELRRGHRDALKVTRLIEQGLKQLAGSPTLLQAHQVQSTIGSALNNLLQEQRSLQSDLEALAPNWQSEAAQAFFDYLAKGDHVIRMLAGLAGDIAEVHTQ